MTSPHHRSRTLPKTGWLLLAGCLLLSACAAPVMERELIRDRHFERGFILVSSNPGKARPYATLVGSEEGSKPVWELAQWGSKYPLPVAPPQRLPGGALQYSNYAKAVTIGLPNSEAADVALTVLASVEYGGHARQSGEPWPHLLLQQRIEQPPTLAELHDARLRVGVRLLKIRKFEMDDYAPGLHAAQFQIFFKVWNSDRQSRGYGQYLWFGVPLYDDRHRVTQTYAAQDAGKVDATTMFIYTLASDVFSTGSTHDQEWITIDRDILPLMREGLNTAWQHGFLKDSQ
ncbi:MAG: hypothetical protein NT167_28320, partial [Verrucomicrobia bacterium]|nr:hypothetical protein [Verrucomicrobiota bacterium]